MRRRWGNFEEEMGKFRGGDGEISRRRWGNFEEEMGKFRGGDGEISRRRWGNFEEEMGKFRGGDGEISRRRWGNFEEEMGKFRGGDGEISRRWGNFEEKMGLTGDSTGLKTPFSQQLPSPEALHFTVLKHDRCEGCPGTVREVEIINMLTSFFLDLIRIIYKET